jgi:nicotinate-nucleotide pyrophosphorylase (carboxylating)
MKTSNEDFLDRFIDQALQEDLGDGDHTSLSCIPAAATGTARLLIKEDGILAGVSVAQRIFARFDASLGMVISIQDGARVKQGDEAFRVSGSVRSILQCERLVLNVMQHMSGIATCTATYVEALQGTRARVLDTRKTTPGMRFLDKQAVLLGGGCNHRIGLYDMILIKDNHIDFAGGIPQAIRAARAYLEARSLNLRIEVEARSLEDIRCILETGGADRILIDNFDVPATREAVALIDGRVETESSGGITLENIRAYALTGVDFISVGALTHHVSALDMSLKAVDF